jgi:hypothetical protein
LAEAGSLDLENQRVISWIKEEWEETKARKRAEIEASLEQGVIHDPVSIAISVAISVALAAASYTISAALAPKPPRRRLGELSGTLQLQNSEQGIMIPEIYGKGPAISLVAGSNPTYQNLTNTTGGANGSITKTSGTANTYNAGATHNTSFTATQDAFIQVIPSTGWATCGFYTTASPTGSTVHSGCLFGLSWGPDGSLLSVVNDVGEKVSVWSNTDVLRIEYREGRFRLYKNSAELLVTTAVSATFPLYMGLTMYSSGAGISNGKVQISSIGDAPNQGRGGIKVPAIIVWSSGIRKVITTSQVPTQGGKGFGGHSQTVDNVSYNIDLGLLFARGPLDLIREYGNADILIDQFTQSANPSGVHDSGVGADDDYDPLEPPDPTLNYRDSFDRVDGDIAVDGDGVGTGTVQGGSSGFAIYPGNDDQQPDPTIESDVDAKYGTGSTPAYKNHALVVHNTLDMSRWGGTVPNITAVWEHQTLDTWGEIFASMCERVGVLTANGDYDFTDLDIACRGLLVSGRPYAPAEIIGSPDIQLAGNFFVTEVEGQLVGFPEGDEPSITIPDTEIGWLEGDGDLPDVLPEIDSILVAEKDLARDVHVKSLDPDNDWDANTQSAMRQITDGSTVELVEINIAQLSDERRATAQRKLYRDYVAGTVHRFTLPWKYLYLHPGYKVTVTRAEGFTHVLRLSSIEGGIGLLTCEGFALEPEIFDQPANGVFPPGYIPPQPIPAMIIATVLDIPQFRDADQDRIGWYAGGTPRTAVGQTFAGWTLQSQRNSVWSLRGSSNLPATIGKVVSSTALAVDSDTLDSVGKITVDLYGTTATLSSVSEDAMRDGENRAIVDQSIFGFTTATQLTDYANRWELTGLLSGLTETEELWNAPDLTDTRFVLLDNAIKFIDAGLDELRDSLTFRSVAVGQSLGDAASFNFAWLGGNLRPRKVTNISVAFDASNDALIKFVGRPRSSEIPAQYVVEIWRSHDRTNPSADLMRSLPVTEGTTHACLLDSTGDTTYDADADVVNIISSHADKNNLSSGVGAATAQTIEDLQATFTRYDFTFRVDTDGLTSTGTLATAGLDHDDVFDTLARSMVTADCPVFIEWSSPDAANIEEKIYNYGVQVGSTRTFAWDSDGQTTRYTILLAGTEYRIYSDYQPGRGDVPLVIIPAQSGGFPFPLRLKMFLVQASIGPFLIDNIVAGGDLFPTTIYSSSQQIEDFGVNQSVLFLRIYQKARYEGIGNPVDI